MGLKKPSKQLPTLSNPAIADEIFYNKEAINQDGEVMTGTVINVNSSTSIGTPSVSGSNLLLTSAAQTDGLHINKGGSVGLITTLSNLGDATTADVASGKTFTSEAGLMVAGTLAKTDLIIGNKTGGFSTVQTTLTLADIIGKSHLLMIRSNNYGPINSLISIKDGVAHYQTSGNSNGAGSAIGTASIDFSTGVITLDSGRSFAGSVTSHLDKMSFDYFAW